MLTGTGPPRRPGLLGLLRLRAYRRLLAVRFASQWTDGAFQAALGGAILFNPEREADPLAVAAGFAVLLLPYSLVSPFAGSLLDRWDRRRVLVLANLLRAALLLAVAVIVAEGVTGPLLYVVALSVAGVSRFVGSGLSVALPHVVDKDRLVGANAFAVTVGAGMAAVGGVSAIGVRGVAGSDDAGSATTILVAVAGAVLAALLAARFARRSLGPDGVPRGPGRDTLSVVLRGYLDGARATAGTPSVAAAFCALGGHRLAFGFTTLLTLLLFRHAFTPAGPIRSGLAGVGQTVVLAAAGLGCAALVTPWAVRRWGRAPTVRGALLVAAATQVMLALALSAPALLAAAFMLGGTGQVVKLCTDRAVQGEVEDRSMGRVFALYDVVFNVGYVAAVAAAALLSPPDGFSPVLVGATAGLYLLGLLGHDRLLARGG